MSQEPNPDKRRSNKIHPDMRDDAPGRIPESLIDAAIDGELDPEIQREIGHALEYDPERRQQFHDTRDAINALRIPVDMPDLSDRVLDRANKHRRFIPAKLRAHVRAGRVGMAALLLVGLLGVAGLQRMYPRLTTIAQQQTPVRDLASAVEQDRTQLAQVVSNEIETIRSALPRVTSIFDHDSGREIPRPGNNNQNYELQLTTASYTVPAQAHYPEFSRVGAVQPGLAIASLMHANESARAQTRGRIRYDLLHADASGHLFYASWTVAPASSSTWIDDAQARDTQDRDTRGYRYEVRELP